MFTLADIRDIAVQIEKNGADIYQRASRQIGDPELSKMIAWMAEEELRHLEWFQGLNTGDNEPSVDPDIEAMGRALLQEMVENRTFSLSSEPLRATQDIFALLVQSLAFEEDTILFYQTLGAFIEDDAPKRQLDAIISEERRHVRQIERMQASIGAGSGKRV